MNSADATAMLTALSARVRLDIYRLLLRHAPDGLVAGEIAGALSVAPSALSFHLKNLVQAGLVTVTAEGRYQRYRASLGQMNALLGYLTEECCAGQPGQCALPAAPKTTQCPPTATRRRAAGTAVATTTTLARTLSRKSRPS